MDFGFGPDERRSVFIVGLDERIDVLSKLFNRCKGCAAQGLAFQDREPALDLIKPGGSGRREVEMDVRVTLEPAVVLGLVGVEIVEDDVDGGIRIAGDDIISFMKSGNSARRRRFLWAAVTLPVATSKAANSVEVPLRL